MLDARRRAVLDAMGIALWRARSDGQVPGTGEVQEVYVDDPVDLLAQVESTRVLPDSETASGPRPVARPEVPPSTLGSIESLDWGALREVVSTCRNCGLHENRTQTVFGVGDQNARLMIIGEAPGADEDRRGEPFVGRAGQLLNAMLEAIGLAREQVYIANIVKCRPPGNRDPHADEADACRAYLQRQIALIAPRLILAVGRVSAHNLLSTDKPVGRLRGSIHRIDPGDVPLIVTYHPAYLLRRPQEKAKSWQDLQAAWRLLQGD